MRTNGRALRRAFLGCLGLLLAGCGERRLAPPSASPGTAHGAAAVPSAARAAALPAEATARDCPEALAALRRLAGGNDDPAAVERAGLVLLEEPGRELASLRLDLPVPILRGPAEAAAGCVLLLEAETLPAERRVVARERVWSERAGPVERRVNPDYERARRELARLADRLDREDREQARGIGRLSPTGDALVDVLGLVGGLVLGGIGSFARDREFAEAEARLEAIPRWIEETRFEPYRVTVDETELLRRATLRLALVEPAAGRFWATVVPLERTDRVRVAIDPHPRDRGRLEGGGGIVAPAELEALAAAPPPIALSELLPRLSSLVAAEPARAGGPREARLAWTGGIATRLAAAAPVASAPTAVARPAGNGAGSPTVLAGFAPPTGTVEERGGTASGGPTREADPLPLQDGPRVGTRGVGPVVVASAADLGRDADRGSSGNAAAGSGRPAGGRGLPVLTLGAGPSGAGEQGSGASRAERPAPERAVLASADPSAPAGLEGRLAAAQPGVSSGPRAIGTGGSAGADAASGRAVAAGAGSRLRPSGADDAEHRAGLLARHADRAESRAAGSGPSGSGVPPGAAASLVRVEGSGGRAHGFYLARDKVLTLARALGASSLARVETADGFVTWGVVAHELPGSELLVLHVPRPGPGLPLAGAGAAVSPAGGLPEAGLPLLVEGRVAGVSLDPLEGRLAGPAELARILAELDRR